MLKFDKNIDHFVEIVGIYLSAHGSVCLEVDEIRFYVHWVCEDDKYLGIQYKGVLVTIPKYMSPCFMGKSIEDRWVCCLLCDFANRLCGTHHQEFFDWELQAAAYITGDGEDCDE